MAPGLYVTEDGKAPLSSSAPPELMTVVPVVTRAGFENLEAAGFDRGIRGGAAGVNVKHPALIDGRANIGAAGEYSSHGRYC